MTLQFDIIDDKINSHTRSYTRARIRFFFLRLFFLLLLNQQFFARYIFDDTHGTDLGDVTFTYHFAITTHRGTQV